MEIVRQNFTTWTLRINKILLTLLSTTILYSCNQKKIITVQWDKYSMGQQIELFTDTIISKKSYSNPYLPFINELDSILGSFKFAELESTGDSLIKGYEFGNYHTVKVKINGDSIKLIRVNIYNKDWVWNQVCIYSDKFGVIAYYPTHRYEKLFLRKKTVNDLVLFQLTDDEIDFIQYDSILNPIPVMPDRPVEIREVDN